MCVRRSIAKASEKFCGLQKFRMDLSSDAILFDCKTLEIHENMESDYGLVEEMEFPSADKFLEEHVAANGRFEGLVGRKPLYSIPGVIEFVECLLYSCSMAQERRRSDELKAVGISMPDLREAIYSTFPEVRLHFPRLGESTVRRLGMAPNNSRKASNYYHCIIPMRKFRIENNRFLFTSQAHSAFAQVNLIYEQCAFHQSQGDSITLFSSDVSQTFNVGGTTLTSRLIE